MKKEYNSPALEIYELNEAVMTTDPESNIYDGLEGDGSNMANNI